MAEAEDTGSSRYGEIKELRRNVTRAVTNYGQGWRCFVIDGARASELRVFTADGQHCD